MKRMQGVGKRRIGDRYVGPVGLGGASWSLHDLPLDAPAVARVLDAATEQGVILVDTAHAYTTRQSEAHNERLLSAALRRRARRDSLLVATKGGHFRSGDAFPVDGRPETIRRHCESSLRALGIDCIDLYQLHLPDPEVPVAESMGVFVDLQREGKIRLAGVSNVSVGELDQARAVIEIASVQNRLRSPKDEVLERCEEHGIAYLAYAPLGGPREAAAITGRRPKAAAIAAAHGVSPQRVVIAAHLACSDQVIAVAGARRPQTIVDSARAAGLSLSHDELAAIEWP
jgi:aryl-alcohol dehydrogenase-like predicted oxidoreductase